MPFANMEASGWVQSIYHTRNIDLTFFFPPWGFEFMAYYMLNKYSASVGSQGITLHLMIVYQVSFDYDNFLNFFFYLL